jgi:hypothetical protein
MARPAFLLDLPFTTLDGWFLRLQCCGRVVSVPLRGLALQRPYGRFGSLLQCLRCRDCGQRPQRVVLTDSPADRAPGTGAPGGWRIKLILPDIPKSA